MALDELQYDELLKKIFPKEPDREQKENLNVLRRATLDYALLLTDMINSSPERDQALSCLYQTLWLASQAVMDTSEPLLPTLGD